MQESGPQRGLWGNLAHRCYGPTDWGIGAAVDHKMRSKVMHAGKRAVKRHKELLLYPGYGQTSSLLADVVQVPRAVRHNIW